MTAIEKANGYRDMMKMDAWRDFELFLKDERQTALELSLNSDDLKDIQVNRGKVRVLDAIQAHVGFILNGNH